MKKAFFFALCLLILLCLFGCSASSANKESAPSTPDETDLLTEQATDVEETFFSDAYITSNDNYTILPAEKVDYIVDTLTIDAYLKRNLSNYLNICYNLPNVLDSLVNITPDQLKRICSIYRFPDSIGTSLGGMTLMIYNSKVYELGVAYGGFGVTEFAYKDSDGENILYYIYSFGSGIHRSHIASFNFKTYEHKVSEAISDDIAFYITEDSESLGICYAEIWWK